MISPVQKAIYSLLQNEPYYAHFILNSNLLYDRWGVPTAGACVVQGVPTLVFNSKFIEKLSHEELTEVLKHEVLHLTFDHYATKPTDDHDKKLWNLAMDCAINQYLKCLPEGCVTLEGMSKAVGYELEAFETSDYYYEHFKKKSDEVNASGQSTVDDHDFDPGDVGDARVNAQAAKAAARKAQRAAAGNLPENLAKILSNEGEAVLPWEQLLRNFVMKRVSSITQATTKKINRRFALPVPGKRKKRTLTLGVCLDSSGSISDESYASFLREVKSIAKNVSKTWLVHADCEVQKVEELGGKTKFSTTRAGGGGTAYQPAIDKCKELGCDVIIYFGDFDSADVPTNPHVPFLWVGVGGQEPPANFGKVIRLP